MKIFSKILLFSAGALMLGLGACKKSYLDRLPSDQVPISDAFKTTIGCKAALEGIHSSMYRATGDESFGQYSINLMNDLMGEDMPMHDQGSGWFVSYVNYTSPRQGAGYIWGFYYQMINNCNELLTHIDAATGSESEKANIKGQVYFYLGFAYYNLSIYYAHTYASDSNSDALCVPIYKKVTQVGNPRATTQQVYKEIVTDLDSAEYYLNPNNGAPSRVNKSEINIDVVHGMQARVALVMQDWPLAEEKAKLARQNYPYMSANELLSGFNNWQNQAWIWGSHLQEDQTNGVWAFISQMDPTSGGYAAIGGQKMINKSLYNFIPRDTSASSTTGYDIRNDWWSSRDDAPYFKFGQKKFRVQNPGSFSIDLCNMRAAEMGFIEAEAQAHQGKLGDAISTLDEIMLIRNPKYTVPVAATSNKIKLLVEIWHQRRIELWGEGFRYSDLQRCAVLDAAKSSNSDLPGVFWYQGLNRGKSGGPASIYGSADGYSALDTRFLFRIPGSEMNYNPNMVQNP